MRESAFERLVKIVGDGSQAQLARRVNEQLAPDERVTPQAVAKWSKKIPAERLGILHFLSGGKVRIEEMRPDMFRKHPAAKEAA